MEINIKKIGKLAGAVCVATGVVAVSALVASGAAVSAITEGFKAAGSTVKKIMNEQNQDEEIVVERAPAEAVENN